MPETQHNDRLSRGYRSSCWRWQVVRRLAACKAPAAGQPAIGTPITGPDRLACSHGDRGHLVGAWDTFRGAREPGSPGARCGCGDRGHLVGAGDRLVRVRGAELVSEAPPWCPRCHFVHRVSSRSAGVCSGGAQGAGFAGLAAAPSGRGSFLARDLLSWCTKCRCRSFCRPGVRLSVRGAALCAPVEWPGRRDLLKWCTRCRFRESPPSPAVALALLNQDSSGAVGPGQASSSGRGGRVG
ncbi:hypothetical protein EV644_12069 [Kribbella orskensis]|uniref:Uncharacterized protein n=1 Tax=Kribbella orskensis TaxID=2512216 RepID=A0ABY2BB45_9ACTN|nr:hypothetical protein EV642_12250 [Kribbella sp. VKM Ac-2500]TCO14445.1 hypothetical protein EV644_12069 [Kribbella orskensis]